MHHIRFLEDISTKEMLRLCHSWQLFDATIDTDSFYQILSMWAHYRDFETWQMEEMQKAILYNFFVWWPKRCTTCNIITFNDLQQILGWSYMRWSPYLTYILDDLQCFIDNVFRYYLIVIDDHPTPNFT